MVDDVEDLSDKDFLGCFSNNNLDNKIIVVADTPPNINNFKSLRLTAIIAGMDYDDIFDTDLINNDLILNDKDFINFEQKPEQPQQPQQPEKKSKSITQSINDLLHSLWEFDNEGIFHKPVNTKAVRDYNKVIKFPMDLSTIKSKSSSYRDLDDLKADLLLISNNAKVYNPPNNYFHNKAVEFEAFFLSLVEEEYSNYVIINDTPVVHQSLPIAWGVYSDDEEESEQEDVEPMQPSQLVHEEDIQQPKPSNKLDVFDASKFLEHLKFYSEPNPSVPLNTPSIYAKKSRFQKKRLTRREQELLERDPYQKNSDGSIKADERMFALYRDD